MIRVAINGYGRIGRSVLRALYEVNPETGEQARQHIQIVAINELADAQAIAHLTQYDTTHGRFQGQVELVDDHLVVNQDHIQLLHIENPEQLPWHHLDVDIVLECTGALITREQCEVHRQTGAKQVLISHPSCQNVDATIIYGVNEQTLSASDLVVSNGSCTTNCVVPVIQVLDQAFQIQSGAITTIHSAMNDQPVIDSYHRDLRRTRAASQSIIPVDTKLARGIERILPHLHNKFEAISVRVPTVNVTAIDLSVTVKQRVNIEQVNQLLAQWAAKELHSILGYTQAPLVSCDFNHDPRSVIVDGSQTRVSDGYLIKMLLWCDNEWGFANRMLDTAIAMHQTKMKKCNLN